MGFKFKVQPLTFAPGCPVFVLPTRGPEEAADCVSKPGALSPPKLPALEKLFL